MKVHLLFPPSERSEWFNTAYVECVCVMLCAVDVKCQFLQTGWSYRF